MIAAATPTLDRHAHLVMALLLVVVVAANADRFVLGAAGPLRAHDVADNTVTSLAACGEFWRFESGWDTTQPRGWPLMAGAFHPQLLMCMVGAAVPAQWLLPLLQTLDVVVLAVGSFLFFRLFLRHSSDVATAGAILSIALFYFFHEHPAQTSAMLLPALAGFLAIRGAGAVPRTLLLAGALAVLVLSDPPGTLILMPLGHLALIIAAPAEDRRRNLTCWTVFWAAYCVYYAPTILNQFAELPNSNRSLFRPSTGIGTFSATFMERLTNPVVLSPAFVLLAATTRRTARASVLFVLVVVAIVAVSAANQSLIIAGFGERFPAVLSLSTMYYRVYYFVPIVVLVWAARLLQDIEVESLAAYGWRILAIGAFCLVIAYPLSQTSRVFIPLWKYSLIIGLTMGLGLRWWTRRTWAIGIVAVAIVLFSRWQFTWVYEEANQGHLFVERPLPETRAPSRVVTIMSDCDAVDVFPAQAAVAGAETLDGISNFYDRRFAERWRHYVADNPASCTGRFRGWNTRLEITAGDLRFAADRILPWLWINNVEFVRSTVPLAYPELELVDEHAFTSGRRPPITRYLYRLRSPVSRVFSLPSSLASRSGTLASEERMLDAIAADHSVKNVPVSLIERAHVRFAGSFASDETLVASMNYHPQWTLRVDGARSDVPLTSGPFGMISFAPPQGHHTYELVFPPRYSMAVPLFMLGGVGLLWFGTGATVAARVEHIRLPRARPAPADQTRRSVVKWTTGGVLVASVAGAAVWASRRPATSRDWWHPDWRYRVPLRTAGAGQTAAIEGFPLRVEFSGDAPFWNDMHPAAADLRFTDAAGTELPFEVEELDAVQRRLIAWVRVAELLPGPQLAAYCYYGNPAASPEKRHGVWDDSYEAVWHLNPRRITAAVAVTDSTGRGHDGRLEGTPFTGHADRGFPFDGTRSIVVDHSTVWNFGNSSWTLDFWFRPDPLNGRNFQLFNHGTGDVAFDLFLHNGGYLKLERRNGTTSSESAFREDPPAPAEWTAVSISATRRLLRLSVNGVPRASAPIDAGFRAGEVVAPLRIGAGQFGNLFGSLAEIRISRLARSADWTLAAYRAQARTFVRAGAVEIAS